MHDPGYELPRIPLLGTSVNKSIRKGRGLQDRLGALDRPEHLTFTTGRRDQAEQQADRGGLAGTVRADEPGHPAFGQVEVDLVDGPQVAEVLGQTGGSDRSQGPTAPSGSGCGSVRRALASTPRTCGARSRRSAG